MISLLKEYISEINKTDKKNMYYDEVEFSEPINQLDTAN